ncbi:heparinase [Occultella glacieicola]|uniref:Heparinase n=1 Tax=Occultella glacieicola TaxID=2518684 RepID=A0ABY2DZJ8_9MICO|nr:heparinase II/III family protein [Occultella glacieicola]TDE89513.1 heparinase [Occultella glacieicola]
MRVSDRLAEAVLREHLPEPGAWRPVPPVDDRAAWDAVDAAVRSVLLVEAEQRCTGPWPTLPATAWLAYARDGLRLPFERHYFARRDRLAAGVVAAALTADDRFLDDVVDGLWAVCEESAWCLPPHDFGEPDGGGALPDPARPSLDLFAAETAAALAWADHVLGPRLADRAPGLRSRIRGEVRRRALAPYLSDTTWRWYSGSANNWNPWIHSNLVAATLLLEDDRERRVATMLKVAAGLDHHLAAVPDDGGCDEGVDYWWRAAASLFECLEWLHSASGGALDLYDEPYLRAAARYPLGVHVGGPWYVNFADGAARADRGASRNGASPRLLHLFGRRIGDHQVQAHARAMRGAGPAVEPSYSLGRVLPALFDADWHAAPPADPPLLAHTWLPRTEVLTARTRAGSAQGPFVAVKGGHNAESHNHNDVGSFVLAWDGDPVVVDAGVGEYTRRTFSADRYQIWTMRSTFHNLPQVGRWEQRDGREFAARSVAATLDEQSATFRADLADAYDRGAGIRSWWREVMLDRAAGQVTVRDTWDLEAAGPLRWHLLLRREPVVIVPGVLELAGERARVRLHHDAGLCRTEHEVIDIDDVRLGPVWGESLHRLTLIADGAPNVGSTSVRFEGAREGDDRRFRFESR